MRFLIDEQLPTALARYLDSAGHEASHVTDVGLGGGADVAIWARAEAEAAVIVTKDADFPTMRAVREAGPPIVWIRMGNTRKAPLLALFERVLPAIVAALEAGEAVVEVSD